jgi:hypothetical protein
MAPRSLAISHHPGGPGQRGPPGGRRAAPAQDSRREVAASEPRSASASLLGEAGSAW